jgi:hypothetical protein
MRYLICTLYLIAAVVIANRAIAEENSDCGIIADPKVRVNCQVDSRIAKTKSTSRKVMEKEKELGKEEKEKLEKAKNRS